MSSNETRLKELERKRPKKWEPLNIVWLNAEAGEKMKPPKPGTLIIYWGAGEDIGSYRYDPNKPNGGRPIKKGGEHE